MASEDEETISRSGVARLIDDPRWYGRLEIFIVLLLIGLAGLSYYILSTNSGQNGIVSPPIAASLLVANLIPAIILLVLIGRRMAKARVAKTALGTSGKLHTRLVALFSLIASIPMLLVVVFAALLFQYGVEFWFSDRARGMLENANDLARGYYEQNQREVGEETVTMANDLRNYLDQARLDSPEFAEGYVFQVLSRKLNESAIIEIGEDGVARTAAAVDPDSDENEPKIAPATLERLMTGEAFVVTAKPDKIEAVTPLDLDGRIFLYAARESDMLALSQWERAQTVLRDYDLLFERSRNLQVQFNVALFLISLLIVGITLWIALILADRLITPVSDLVSAAKRVAQGDLKARVSAVGGNDEIATLGRAFNQMTVQLDHQTGELMGANRQLENRRAFIEAVLESVSAGVISLDANEHVRLVNGAAQQLLGSDAQEIADQPLRSVFPELADMLASGASQQIVELQRKKEILTLDVKISGSASGKVITFEDITQKLLDQRRAAWSDVARRIAHEIKNPLTPIQLAAERLQRRFAGKVSEGQPVFEQLTGTIVRQVGDLRNIVDEFSAFARMPKPVFREEKIAEVVEQAKFLQQVAQSEIQFSFEADDTNAQICCDRRQLGQAFTNIIKNAAEAIQMRAERDDGFHLRDGVIEVGVTSGGQFVNVHVNDNGIGLPENRDQILEPYVTTRAQGTGLGLAIVKKIVEEHFGEIMFDDNELGGTRVQIRLDKTKLSNIELRQSGEGSAVPVDQDHKKVSK